jgi:hypothetical protein
MKTLPGFRTLLAVVLLSVLACASHAQPFRVFDYTNITWRYNDVSTSASNPGSTFMQPLFDDSTADWKTGRALFGNDDNGVYNGTDDPFRGGINGFATPLTRTGGRVTFYFRTHFNFPTNPANVILYSTNYLDDGMIVYINGQDAGRIRVPAGAVTWDTLGSNPPAEGVPEFLQLSAAGLVEGDNVVAVEVHQSGTGSSDVAFAMQLTAIIPFSPSILVQPTNVTVVENRSTTLRAVASASPPISYQWFHNGVEITGATAPTYNIPPMSAADAGEYFLRVSNPVGSVDSDIATVTFVEDETPPFAVSAMGSSDFTSITIAFDHLINTDDAVDTFLFTLSGGSGAPGIQTLTLRPNGYVVVMTLDAAMEPNTEYSIDFGPVRDLAGNALVEPGTISFRTFTLGCGGGALFEAYNTGGGNAVSMLLTNVNYPANPQDRAFAPTFDSRNVYTDDGHEGYGGRMRGLFVPTVSGDWVFYLASDDASELWFNPAGPDSAGKVKIAEELGCCGVYEPLGSPETSVPIALVAGRAYYIEALYKEGTGGDYVKVAAGLATDPRPTFDNGLDTDAIPASMLGYPAGPADALAGVTIATQPNSPTVLVGTPATFSVQLSPDVPACYQWKRDGVDIPGATGQYYRFTPTMADDGAKFSVTVRLMGGHTLESTEGTLDVFEDVAGPSVVSASTDANKTNILVTFSEAVDTASATTVGNYNVPGSTIARVEMANATTANVILATPLAACASSYSITVTGVKDVFNNVQSPSPATVNFSFAGVLLIGLTGTHPWTYEASGTELGDAWYASAFNDTSWSNGVITFAFPAGEVIQAGYPVRTVLPAVLPTTYFRTHFNLPTSPSTVTNLQLQAILDDGAVFYLNGQELTRVRMPAGPVDINTLASAGSPSDPPQILETFTVPSTALRSGDNVLAARVHQSATTSSDTVFAAGLTAFVSECRQDVTVSISKDGSGTITISASSGTIHKASSVTGPWSPVGPGPIVINPNQQQSQEFYQVRP